MNKNSSQFCHASDADGFREAKAGILAAEQDSHLKRLLLNRFNDRCRFPNRAILLWDKCIRESRKYTWPDGFKDRFRRNGHRGLVNAMRNGPPRTAFTVAGGEYRSGWELDHIYDRPILRRYALPEGRHFTQSAGLVCMTRDFHLNRDTHDLWLLRGISYLLFGYDPLGAFNSSARDEYGFVQSRECEVFWY